MRHRSRYFCHVRLRNFYPESSPWISYFAAFMFGVALALFFMAVLSHGR